MTDEKRYGDGALYTQLQAPRAGGDHVVVPVMVDHRDEDGDREPSLAGSIETRAVTMTKDEAREYGLALLTAAGPSTDELVRTWIMGQVRITVETPNVDEASLIVPIIAPHPQTQNFDRLLALFGGLGAFEDFKPSFSAIQFLRGEAPALDPTLKAARVSVQIPESMLRPAEEMKMTPELRELVARQMAQKAQTGDEQAAADSLVEQLAAPASGGVMDDPLAPGPGKDGH